MTGADSTLSVTVPASPDELRGIRRLVAEFAQGHGADATRIDVIVLVVHEACGNIVRHSYGSEIGPLEVRAAREGDYLQFVVNDNGTPAADPNAGKGADLAVNAIKELSDDVDIEGPGPNGTRIRVTLSLHEGSERREHPDFEALR
jgi:anti-sigma regulatory factor (Ser/Thr protein kinase)